MTPTFADGERVLAVRRHRIRRGDVVVFRPPPGLSFPGGPPWRIKRVAAVAGDPTPEALRRYRGSRVPAAVVPAGHVVVVGDNPNSQDSRQLGDVPVRAIAGRVHPHRSPADRVHRTDHPPIASRRPSRRR